MTLEDLQRLAEKMEMFGPDALFEADGTVPLNITELGQDLLGLLAVARAAQTLVGCENIGKTVDTSIEWDGAVSAIFKGAALSAVVKALAALEGSS